MQCSCSGRRKEEKTGTKRKLKGAASARTSCPMAFWLVAEDYTDLMNSTWRVLHMQNRKSIVHNHAPVTDSYVFAKYRGSTRNLNEAQRVQLVKIFEGARGAKQALIAIRDAFPDTKWTCQDVKNEYRRCQYEKLGTRTRVKLLVKEMDEAGWWHPQVS